MKIIEPSVELMRDFDGAEVMKFLEKCGRTAYKSENNITEGSAEKFIKNIIKRGHESVLEHFSVTFKIICDRGVSHELVRHRLCSFTQESTRYCNYASGKFGGELTFIQPCFWNFSSGSFEDEFNFGEWFDTMKEIEKYYKYFRKDLKVPPEQARLILPNSLKTEIVMTANLREFRHFLELRMTKNTHPQMRQIAFMIFRILSKKLPVIFEDFTFVGA